MSKKKILGYGFRLSNEKLQDAVNNYDLQHRGLTYSLFQTKQEALEDIEQCFKEGSIKHNAKPKIFAVYLEDVEIVLEFNR